MRARFIDLAVTPSVPGRSATRLWAPRDGRTPVVGPVRRGLPALPRAPERPDRQRGDGDGAPRGPVSRPGGGEPPHPGAARRRVARPPGASGVRGPRGRAGPAQPDARAGPPSPLLHPAPGRSRRVPPTHPRRRRGRRLGGRPGAPGHRAGRAVRWDRDRHGQRLARPRALREAAYASGGIRSVADLPGKATTIGLLRGQPLVAGPSVVILTNVGGGGVLAADACTAAGLVVEPLPDDLQARLRAVLPWRPRRRGAPRRRPSTCSSSVPPRWGGSGCQAPRRTAPSCRSTTRASPRGPSGWRPAGRPGWTGDPGRSRCPGPRRPRRQVLFGTEHGRSLDRAGIGDCVRRVGWLADALPEVMEIDVNPLGVAPGGVVALDVRIRVSPVLA